MLKGRQFRSTTELNKEMNLDPSGINAVAESVRGADSQNSRMLSLSPDFFFTIMNLVLEAALESSH